MMLTLFTMLGSLALLMFGMKSMSEALQKMAGPQLRHALGAMTSNRFTGLLTGSVVTASVQSSTATTVMTVQYRVLHRILPGYHPHLYEEAPLYR